MNPAELAAKLSDLLTRAGIPHAIGGAVAYGFWGNPRGTRDLDLNIFVRTDLLTSALAGSAPRPRLRGAGWSIASTKMMHA